MIDRPALSELGVAGLGGLTAVAGSYAAAGYSPAFVVAPIDALVVDLTPGVIVTFVIQNVGAPGHLLHIALSALLAVGLFGAVTLAGRRVVDWAGSRVAGAVPSGLLAWGITTVATGAAAPALGAAMPLALFVGLVRPTTVDGGSPAFDAPRRRVLGAVAGFVGLSAAAGTLRPSDDPLGEAPNTDGVDQYLQAAEAQSLDAGSAGLTGLVSDVGAFYNTDIAEFDPELAAADWSMTITGETGADDLTVTYDEVTGMPAEHRYVTLRCVGEQLNGRKLDTAVWTGTPIAPLLDEVDPAGDCDCVLLRGDDGYFVRFPTEVLRTGFLAWGMNGRTLPTSHGYPVRVLIPGHWGETNVKWLTEIELLDEPVDGYWERRGWEGTGPVTTVAKLWDEGVTHLEDGRVELAGHAYAGLRGVGAVEVSTDGGENWTEATLSEPLPGDDVWRQWQHVYEPDGTHEVVVRAVDREGRVQTEAESSPAPSGATGWVSRTIDA